MLTLSLTSIELYAQEEEKAKDTTTTWQLVKHDAKSAFNGIIHAATRPVHWKGRDYAKLGYLVLGTSAISLTDRPTSDFFRRQDGSFPQVLQDFGWYFGAPQNFLIANAGLYGFGLLTKNEAIRRTSVLIISSSVTAGYIQIMARSLIGRARPFAEDGVYTFKFLSNDGDYLSFPSGHTVLGITMAHSIAKQFDNIWTKIGIYSLGSIPAISRLVDGAHWLSDVAFGAAFAVIVVDCVDKFLFDSNAYSYPKKEKVISWNLKFGAGQIGFVGTF